jgi:hypothetical protein
MPRQLAGWEPVMVLGALTKLAADGHAEDGAGFARAFYRSVRSRSTR